MQMLNKGKIVCGFAGIGKSTMAKNGLIVDLESTPFNRDWEVYVNVIEHMSNNGYSVAVSCHKELREELHRRKIDYILALPRIDDKEEYIKRYKERGNEEGFMKLLDENWDNFNEVYEWEEVMYIKDYLMNELR